MGARNTKSQLTRNSALCMFVNTRVHTNIYIHTYICIAQTAAAATPTDFAFTLNSEFIFNYICTNHSQLHIHIQTRIYVRMYEYIFCVYIHMYFELVVAAVVVLVVVAPAIISAM